MRVLFRTIRSAVPPLPKDIFDLSQWRLDLPTNAAGELFHNTTNRNPSPPPDFVIDPGGDVSRSTATNKSAAELVAGYTSPYFFGSFIRGVPYVNLRSPIFGATSTPTTLSNNARVELRGLLTGGGPIIRSQSFQGLNQPKISGRWALIASSAGSGSTSDICQIHPGTQDPGYSGPVNSGSVFLIFLWRESTGNLESAVRDVNNPAVQWNSGQTPNNGGRLIVMTDFQVGDELDFEVEWDCTVSPNVLKYTLQQYRDGSPLGGVVNINHEVQSGWADLHHYFKSGAYSSKNVLDSADCRPDPAPTGYPSENTGGLLAPENVTDVNWSALRNLTQELLNPSGT